MGQSFAEPRRGAIDLLNTRDEREEGIFGDIVETGSK